MSAKPKRILLAGATGYIGRAVARALLDTGYAVTALTRSTPVAGLEDCSWIVADVTDASSLDAAISGNTFDAVISCIASRSGAAKDARRVDYDANIVLLNAAQSHSATQFVLLSAICVQRPKLAFQHAKLAFEEALRQAPIDHSIVRPTAFFRSLSGQIKRVQQGKAFLLFGDGNLTACKPISEADLANYLVDCLSNPAKRNQTLPIGGPGDAISLRQQGELLFELTGMPEKFKSVTPKFFTILAALLTPAGKLFPSIAAKAEFLRIGHYYATESMLFWDEDHQHYSAALTPSTGTTTLREHYETVLRVGITGHEAGDQKLF